MKYIHQDNRDKPYVDWRLPENRIKMCTRSYGWRMKHRDIDHYTYNEAYMNAEGTSSPTGNKMTREQRIYFSLLFGITYQSSMAWTIYWFFPHLDRIDFKLLEEWNNKNYARQQFAKDTKYNKGKFIRSIRELQEEILNKNGSLENWVDNFQNFEDAFNKVTSIYKFGRMTGWLATQAIYELCNVRQIEPKNMLATDPSNWSVRSGLAFVFNREDLMDLDGKKRYSSDDVKWIEDREKEFYDLCAEHVRSEDLYYFSPYTLETHLCQYKKMIATGGDAPGTPTQDAYTRCYKLHMAWGEEVDYSPFMTTVHYAAPCVQKTFQNKILMKTGALTGQMINMHEDNEDLPDMYKEFNVPHYLLKSLDTINSAIIKENVQLYCDFLEDKNSIYNYI